MEAKKPSEKDTEPSSTPTFPHENTPSIQKVPQLALAIPDSPTEHRKIGKKLRDGIDVAIIVVQIVGLVVLIFYTSFAALQWHEMKKAAKATQDAAAAATSAANTANQNLINSKESFQIDRRPYVVAEMPEFVVLPTVAGTGTSANITFKSIGKTPAIRMKSQIALLRFHPLKKTPRGTEKVVRFMQDNFQILEDKIDAGNKEKYSDLARQDLAPNATRFSTANLEEPITAQEIADLQKGELLLLFYIGVVRYTDAYNGSYETQFCYFYLGTEVKTWHICDNHNVIK